MECDIPCPDNPIRTRASQPLLSVDPEDNIDPSSSSVLNRNIAQWELGAPDIDVSVEGTGSDVLTIGSPCEREDTAAVERPPGCDELFE